MFWENFVRFCNSKDKAPNAVAKEIGIPSGSVTDWKNGRTPQHRTLIKIADYFGVTVDYLLGNTDSREKPKEKTPSEEGEKDGKDVVVVFRGGERIVQHVTPEQAALIDNLLKQFDAKQGNT